jgi:hypothetical protein
MSTQYLLYFLRAHSPQPYSSVEHLVLTFAENPDSPGNRHPLVRQEAPIHEARLQNQQFGQRKVPFENQHRNPSPDLQEQWQGSGRS